MMIEQDLQTCKDFDKIYKYFLWRISPSYNVAYDVCDKHSIDPTKVALYYESEEGKEATYTFSQLKRLSNRFANALIGLGVQRGDRVGIYLPQRPEAALVHLATLKIGGISVPMTPMFGPEAISHRMNDCQAKILVFAIEDNEKILDTQNQLKTIEHLIAVGGKQKGAREFDSLLSEGSEDFKIAATSADDPAFLVYTSGTTGLPKGALHAHRCIPGRLTGLEMAHNFLPQEGDLFWTPADWAWIGGLLDSLIAPWAYGIPVLAAERRRFDPERAFALIEKYRVRNAFLPPLALKIMSNVTDASHRYKTEMRSVHSGGESLPLDVLNWGKETFHSLCEMYGMTEMGFVVGNCPAILPIKPGSMGKAYPGHPVELVDEAGQVLPPGQLGEVAIHRSDPGMFLGYWGNREATEAKFIGDWMLSSDLAIKDEEGYFWFRGRKDDVITSAGYRIGPEEIEKCIFRHPSVQDVAVIASPDPIRGSIVKAFIMLKKEIAPSEVIRDEIQAMVKKNLGAYEYPREIEFLEDFPRTVTGKIQRHVLREWENQKKAKKE
jgi:acetyl-CoA synthetase